MSSLSSLSPLSPSAYTAIEDAPLSSPDTINEGTLSPASGEFAILRANGRLPPPEYQSELLLDKYGDSEARMAFVSVFPSSLEMKFKPFDDYFIEAWQHRFILSHAVLPKYYAAAFSGFTAIETGVGVPITMYLLGWDALASRAAVLVFVLALLSQIPKRFLWRARPYMTEPPRSIRVRQDKTSSFPSRAVTCAVVYGYFISDVVTGDGATTWRFVLIAAAICTFCALSASFSRIYFGVHYASDCVGGIFMGTLISTIGSQLYDLQWLHCSICRDFGCYAKTAATTLSLHNWSSASTKVMLLSSFVCCIIVIFAVLPPLRFWAKCSHIYGMLLPCFVFRMTCMCPDNNDAGFAIGRPSSPGWASVGVAVATVSVLMALGFFTSKKLKKMGAIVQVAMFLLIFALELTVLMLWRLTQSS